MSDTPGRGCGLFLVFRGWAKKACNWHDDAFTEGSSQQKAGIPVERVNQQFGYILDELAKEGTFKYGKRKMGDLMEWIASREVFKPLYEIYKK